MRKMYFAVLFLLGVALLLSVGTVSAATTNSTTLTTNQVNSASATVESYAETNHKIPGNVTISGKKVSMPQFLEISTTAVLNIDNNSSAAITMGNYKSASSPTESIKSGFISYNEYITIAKNVESYMDSNGRAPNYATSSQGNIRYESLIYMYSQILNSYNKNKVLPDYIAFTPWAVVSNKNTVFYSINQVNNASKKVKSFIEANHRLPNTVNISGKQISMPQFLELLTTALINIDGKFYASIALGSYKKASKPTETVKSGYLDKLEYLEVACNIKAFMDTSGQAPNYAQSSLGNMRFESLIYMYSKILNYYSLNGNLPEDTMIQPWKVVSDTKAVLTG